MTTTEHPIVSLIDEEEFDILRYDEGNLKAGTVYVWEGSFGYSPDGVGMYWYDSMEDLVEDVG